MGPRRKTTGPAWRQRWRYVSSPVALIDAAALAPSAVAVGRFLTTGGGPNLSFLPAVRLLTRTVKLARYFPRGRLIAVVVRQRRANCSRRRGTAAVTPDRRRFDVLRRNERSAGKLSSIPAAMWWSVVTLTTVGYGDTVPVTPVGRVLAAVIAVPGIGLFALPAGILSAGLLEANINSQATPGSATPTVDRPLCPHCCQPMPGSVPD